jgi:glycine/D-amino acid oxidase-like deaminating enzyme
MAFEDLPALPDSVDVVVIGGGIIGVSTTYFLAKKGVSVLLCEKGVIAGEQSSRNWGFVRQQGRAPEEVPLVMESLRIWRGIEREIGDNVGFHQGGVIYTAKNDRDIAQFEQFVEIAKQHQLDTRMLTGAELKQLVPGITGNYTAALHTPSDGRAEPRLAAPAIARAAERAGAHIATRCAVRGLERRGGKVAGVVTERGSVKTSTVVLAGGIWSSLLCGNHDVDLPQLRIQNNVFRTTQAPVVTEGAIWADDVALRRRQDGGYTVAHGHEADFHVGPEALRWFYQFQPAYRQERGSIRLRLSGQSLRETLTRKRWNLDDTTPFEATRVMNPKPRKSVIMETFAAMRRAFPDLQDVGIAETWAGLIDVTPDAIPVISPVEAVPGFYVSTGYSGHGFGIGPGAGRVTADLVTGTPNNIDLKAFRFERFADGSANPFGGAV